MKDLKLFEELTISEQEKISGGMRNLSSPNANPNINGFVMAPGKPLVSQCGDVLTLPGGTTIRDTNCADDPVVSKPIIW